MSEISSSHQLVAAAIAFHRARRKFTENQCETMRNNSKFIQPNDASDNPTKNMSRYCCRKNCESIANKLHNRKKNGNFIVEDFDEIASNKACKSLSISENTEDTGTRGFENAKNGFVVYDGMNNAFATKNCCCSENMRTIRQNCINGDTINQLSTRNKSQNCNDSRDDDALLDFPSKLYEWERRSREETLMKMQRFQELKVKKYKQEAKCKSFHARHMQSQLSPVSIDDTALRSSCKKLDKKMAREKWKLLDKLHSTSCPVSEESDTDNDSEIRRIKHRDSIDILVEKFKAKSIQEDFIDEVGGFSNRISNTILSNEIEDQMVSNETAKECKKSKENVDTETCCTRKKPTTKELRSNKLANRLRHKCRRSRLTKSAICYSNEETSFT